MKKVNLISKAEMRQVKGGGGGGGGPECPAYVMCSNDTTGDNMIPFTDACCGSLSDAGTYCHNHGYWGLYTCYNNIGEA